MSDDAKRPGNYRPGDDGNLTTGDFHKLVAEAFLSAMRPHYDLAAEKWWSMGQEAAEMDPKSLVPPYLAFRKKLDFIEQAERGRAEQSVRRILAMQAKPSTGLIKELSPADDAPHNVPR